MFVVVSCLLRCSDGTRQVIVPSFYRDLTVLDSDGHTLPGLLFCLFVLFVCFVVARACCVVDWCVGGDVM